MNLRGENGCCSVCGSADCDFVTCPFDFNTHPVDAALWMDDHGYGRTKGSAVLAAEVRRLRESTTLRVDRSALPALIDGCRAIAANTDNQQGLRAAAATVARCLEERELKS